MAMVGSRFTKLSASRTSRRWGLGCGPCSRQGKVLCSGMPQPYCGGLLCIFSDWSLDMPNGTLHDLKEKTLRYRSSMLHITGMKNKAADAMPHHPSSKPDLNDITLCWLTTSSLSQKPPPQIIITSSRVFSALKLWKSGPPSKQLPVTW